MLAFDAMNAFLDAEVGIDLHRVVHGEQRFAYERPIVPGDVLTATLTVASLRQIGGHDIIGTPSEITDDDRRAGLHDHATLVHRGGMRDAGPLSLPSRPTPSPAPTWSRYAGASGDFNPIHRTDRVARSVGLPGVIAHGMFTLALAARAVDELARRAGRGRRARLQVHQARSWCPPTSGVEVEIAGEVKAATTG